jgi:hypothetical protein
MIASPDAEIELCCSDPKLDVDLFVESGVLSLTSIILGRTTIAREKEAGSLFLSGDALLARTMNRWLHLSDYSRAEGVLMLRQKARAPL